MLQSPLSSTYNMDFINMVIWSKNNIVKYTWYVLRNTNLLCFLLKWIFTLYAFYKYHQNIQNVYTDYCRLSRDLVVSLYIPVFKIIYHIPTESSPSADVLTIIKLTCRLVPVDLNGYYINLFDTTSTML
jgi:hypothetical protein